MPLRCWRRREISDNAALISVSTASRANETMDFARIARRLAWAGNVYGDMPVHDGFRNIQHVQCGTSWVAKVCEKDGSETIATP